MVTRKPTRVVSWGEGLVVAGFRAPGGLKVAVDRIHAAVGDYIGTRNTFAKLQRVEDPTQLAERDRFRAWLLITALGEQPSEWGIDDDVVPSIATPARLRALLCPEQDSNLQPTGWWIPRRALPRVMAATA